jgi:hypothetical protein
MDEWPNEPERTCFTPPHERTYRNGPRTTTFAGNGAKRISHAFAGEIGEAEEVIFYRQWKVL